MYNSILITQQRNILNLITSCYFGLFMISLKVLEAQFLGACYMYNLNKQTVCTQGLK